MKEKNEGKGKNTIQNGSVTWGKVKHWGKAKEIIFLVIISLSQQPQNSCTLVSILYISNSSVLIMADLKVS